MEGCVVLALDGVPSDDVDFDADQGALLVVPTAVAGCEAIDEELRRAVER